MVDLEDVKKENRQLTAELKLLNKGQRWAADCRPVLSLYYTMRWVCVLVNSKVPTRSVI